MGLIDKFQEGCTGISWIVALWGKKLPGHECCDEHDLAYEQGGSISWKLKMDLKLARCIHAKNGGGVIGKLKAVGAWLAVTINPYPYIVWNRPDPEGQTYVER